LSTVADRAYLSARRPQPSSGDDDPVPNLRLPPARAYRGDGDGPPILIVPGLYNSGPDHWQSHWEREVPGAERVDQQTGSAPLLGDWTISLAEAVRQRPGAILVAHSLGCALVAHFAQVTGGRGVGGAMLVAPADVNREGPAGRLLVGFSPIPRQRLPFPSLVVASRDDPYVEIERAEAFARGWGSEFVDLGRAGHINVDVGTRASG
jgi:predicted alpha/beta hydrolase family esterase